MLAARRDGGVWGADDGRTKAIFAAASALFLVFVALEYDIKFLDRLTKFRAGEVDFELNNSQRPNQGPQLAQGNIDSTLVAAFPRTDVTDGALKLLYNMGQSALRDEMYADVLAGGLDRLDAANPSQITSCGTGPYADVFCHMELSKRLFASYACGRIEPFVGKLAALQTIHRSEISALAIDPKLIAFLRRSYYKTQQPHDPQSIGCGPYECNGLYGCSDYSGSPRNLGEALCQSDQWTMQELQAIKAQIKGSDAAKKYLDQKTQECGQLSPDLLQPEIASWTVTTFDPTSNLAAYLALTIALAEDAIGNGESAIHLLDSQMLAQRGKQQELLAKFEGTRSRHLSLCSVRSPLSV